MTTQGVGWASEGASELYYLRDEEIRGLKPLLDRIEELTLDAVRKYVLERKSEKKFKAWPGVAADLLASHRDALGNWITEAAGTGKWEKEPNTVYTSLSPVATQPLTPTMRGARERAIVSKSSVGKRKQSISDDTLGSDPASEADSDSDSDFASRKRAKTQSRQGEPVTRKSQRKPSK